MDNALFHILCRGREEARFFGQFFLLTSSLKAVESRPELAPSRGSGPNHQAHPRNDPDKMVSRGRHGSCIIHKCSLCVYAYNILRLT